jgi:hypothetical protein
MNNIVGIYLPLTEGETLEMENPSVSLIDFEKSSFFNLKKKYDTCLGKIYLTNKRIIILRLILLEAKNMRIDSVEQFGSALGQWFDIDLNFITNINTANKSGIFGNFLNKLLGGEKKEGLEIHYESPMEIEKKSFFGGSKTVREKFKIIFTVDNKDLWSLKIQTNVGRIQKQQ